MARDVSSRLNSGASEFAADSPLEGNGFELVVPRHESRGFLEQVLVVGAPDLSSIRYRWFADSALEAAGFERSLPVAWIAEFRISVA